VRFDTVLNKISFKSDILWSSSRARAPSALVFRGSPYRMNIAGKKSFHIYQTEDYNIDMCASLSLQV